jgi:hypothetical protein
VKCVLLSDFCIAISDFCLFKILKINKMSGEDVEIFNVNPVTHKVTTRI